MRADDANKIELGHEGDKLRAFTADGNPVTGRPFGSVHELLADYISHNLPEPDETFFSVVDGRADRRSPQPPMARLDRDAGFLRRAAAATTPTRGQVDTSAGPAYWATFPVRLPADGQRGSLVVVEFRGPDHDKAWSVARVITVVGAGALLMAGVAGWLVAGRVLAPIRLVRQTAEEIGESDLGRRIEVAGTDDVAQLARTFNRMLDRIQAAFAGQRRFLDDAGHELRTPITIIRGHLELMGDDPVERGQTTELVLDELDRMSRIVDDLMVLAKSEQPDFLVLAPVDLTDLIAETLAKARPLAARRWSIDEASEETIRADGQRLAQALLQLVTNAARHTTDGETIAVGSRVQDGRVYLWVRDTGEGIAAADQERIFDRFVRGAGGHDREGAGLGLPIVATIAHAHGGRVHLRSEPGHGSTFTLDLPLVPERASGKTSASEPAQPLQATS